MPDDSFKSRLLEFLKAKKLTQTEFCRQLEVSTTYVGAMRKGMPAEKLKKLGALYPDLNKDWLMYGEGPMLLDDSDKGETCIGNEYQTLLLPVEAFAGGLQAWSQGVKTNDCRKIVSPVSGADYAIPIKGDSMEPRFHDGSTLLIKKINDQAFIPWGHTMVIDTENGVFIKNLLPDTDAAESQNGEYLIAESLNPKYPPFKIPKSSIYGIYRVMGTIDYYTAI